ncbi:MAG TPA: alpha/beta hydrolase, partial [Allosphingosinicella sp.]|nr:alpha/beta hydrolase [Allosphingosinicella sp.]
MNFRNMALCAAAILLGGAGDKMESFVEARGPSGPLKGTMVSPAATAPLVLIIPGSGPTDRDGNNPMGVKASTYRLLAQGLAKRGVASVRIDKRGMFASAAAVPDGNSVTIEDYAADVEAWIASIRERTGSKCVWVAGHSECGLVALAAAKSVPDICGLILISAPGRRMGDVMRAQLRANPANAPVLDDALSAIGKLEAGQTVDVSSFHPALQNLFAPPVQKFLISLFSFDPADLLRRETKPVLILHGENDLQVGPEDAQRLAESRATAKLIL